jgi:PRTRC genetic system ThiF family protein
MTNIHFVPSYWLNPPNPITVNLIGAGGTGSQVLTTLARINHALLSLNHPGLFVTVWDKDRVSESNLGRQLFTFAELGLFKSEALINRTNRFFGTDWTAINQNYSTLSLNKGAGRLHNLTITCVDTVAARVEVARTLKREHYGFFNSPHEPHYWLDFGNGQNFGQSILATVGKIDQPDSDKYTTVASLPFVTDEYGDLLKASETDDDTPSCSLAEALTKQDLFINSTLAQMGSNLLWSMFREGMIDKRGFFLNLKEFRSQPIKL